MGRCTRETPMLTARTDVFEIEGRIPREYGSDAVEIPGARAMLEELQRQKAPWMIVTSGTRPLLTGWLEVMKLAVPPTTVVAEDVPRGKPDPSCYLLGADRLGLPSDARVLVVEDAPAGVQAGKAAGFQGTLAHPTFDVSRTDRGATVVALATTHTVSRLQEAGADWIVQDLRSVQLDKWDAEAATASVSISNTLVR